MQSEKSRPCDKDGSNVLQVRTAHGASITQLRQKVERDTTAPAPCEGEKKLPKRGRILYKLLKDGRIACEKSRYVVSFNGITWECL